MSFKSHCENHYCFVHTKYFKTITIIFYQIGYDGDYCEDDFDGCTEVSCFNNATCTDVPAPGTGVTCPPCPRGYIGNGIICYGQ